MTSTSSARGAVAATVALLISGSIAAGLVGAWLGQGAPTPDAGVVPRLLPLVAWSVVLAVVGLFQRRVRGSLVSLSLLGCVVAIGGVLALYAGWVESLLRYPADILRWSESPFVQDIIHFRTGQPLYGTPDDMASFEYPPLTQLATYAVASAAGAATSIPAYRVIQLGWIMAASVVGTLAVMELLRLAQRERDSVLAVHPVLGGAFVVMFLFLVGTNPITSPHAHTLHNDSLAVFISVVAFWLLARFARTQERASLIALCFVPVVGFLTKQSLAIWAPMIALALLLFGGPGAFRRAVVVGGIGIGLIVLANLVAPLLWGSDWDFWIFGVLGTDRVSVLRSLRHLIETWIVPAMCIGAGLFLISTSRHRSLVVLWLLAFGFYLVQAYTSGIAWMLNHMAPGSFLVGIWTAAALMAIWPRERVLAQTGIGDRMLVVGRTVAFCALTLLLVAGFDAIREPVPGLPRDATRYREDIERNVEPLLADGRRVLLDHGSWVYLSRNLAVGDRSAAAGELGAAEKSDFAAFKARIAEHYYDRILVRDLQSPYFFYDYHLWRRSSGIRAALLEHYEVVRVIPAVQGAGDAYFRDVFVLEPRSPGPGAPPTP